jgi:hypothetical protein
VSKHVASLPLSVLRTANLLTVGSCIISNQLVQINHVYAHDVNTCIVFTFKSVLPYEVYTYILQGVIMTSLVLVHDHTFGHVSSFWQDLQDLFDWIVLCILSSTSHI